MNWLTRNGPHRLLRREASWREAFADCALTEDLAALLRNEHRALADFLVALADFDRRRLWVELGHSSLWYFLHRELRLSKSAAQYRKVAAELIQEIPGIVDPLQRGDLCLTSIIEVAKVVNAENWDTILPRFYGLSRREAMEVVAELQPHPAPPARTVVAPVRADPPSQPSASQARVARDTQPIVELVSGEEGPQAPESTAAALVSRGVSSSAEPDPSTSRRSAPPVTSARPFEIVPLTAEQSRMHVTVSREFMKKLEAARDAMSHARPDATPAEILEAGLELLLAQAAKRKGLVERPREQPRPMTGDGVPAHVRREVWKRDGGKCQWPIASGGVCGSTRQLELDHVRPRCRGGASTVENLRLLCRGHNDLAARVALGEEWMDRFTLGMGVAPRRGARRTG